MNHRRNVVTPAPYIGGVMAPHIDVATAHYIGGATTPYIGVATAMCLSVFSMCEYSEWTKLLKSHFQSFFLNFLH